MKSMFRRLAAVILCLCLVFSAAVYFGIKPLLLFFVKNELRKVFPQSLVAAGGCSFDSFGRISFYDIKISRDGWYEAAVEEASVSWRFIELLKPSPFALSLKEASIRVDIQQKDINFISSCVDLGDGAARDPLFCLIEARGAAIDVCSKNLMLKARVSAGFDFRENIFDYADITVESAKFEGVFLQSLSFKTSGRSNEASCDIKSLDYKKFDISDVKGRIRWDLKEAAVAVSGLCFKAFGGQARLDGRVAFLANPSYEAAAVIEQIDVEQIVRKLELADKFMMSGKFSGNAAAGGQGNRLRKLSGLFSALPPGGTLVITNADVLKSMAKGGGRTTALLMEQGFKNYRYDEGTVTLGLGKDAVNLGVRLNGAAGRRDLDVALHHFLNL